MKNLAIMSVTTLSLISTSHSLERVASHVHKIVPALMVAATTVAVAADGDVKQNTMQGVPITEQVLSLAKRTNCRFGCSGDTDRILQDEFYKPINAYKMYLKFKAKPYKYWGPFCYRTDIPEPSKKVLSLSTVDLVSRLVYEQNREIVEERMSNPLYDGYGLNAPDTLAVAIHLRYLAFQQDPASHKDTLKEYLNTVDVNVSRPYKLAQLLDQDPVPQEFHDAFSNGIFKLD